MSAPLILVAAVAWLDFPAGAAAAVGDRSSPTSARDAVSSSAARLERPVGIVGGGLWDCNAPVPIYPARATTLARLSLGGGGSGGGGKGGGGEAMGGREVAVGEVSTT